jgi:uncharacterized membrane protein
MRAGIFIAVKRHRNRRQIKSAVNNQGCLIPFQMRIDLILSARVHIR